MNWNALSPYLVPLLVGAILLRRALRAQKAKRVRFATLWIFPILLLLVTLTSLAREPATGFGVIAAFVAAGLAGGTIGWYRVHTLAFSVEAESGRISARPNKWGALLVLGLIALRYFADVALKRLGFAKGADLVHATDAVMVFTTAMLVAQSVHTWIRARAALSAHRSSAPPGGMGSGVSDHG
ncbi:MAG TPA: hypothetical protein VGL35_10050 [Rhizomicrobium sp.]|jgi:hypothetical protein